MSDNSSIFGTIVSVLVQWAPMLVLIGVYVYMMRKYLGPRRNGMTNSEYLSALLQEKKRHNEVLENILAQLSHRPPQ